MSIRLTFEIQLFSDYHVGAGQRVGLTVDSALLRDHDLTPVLRGTSLAGLLRDGLKDLQRMIENNNLQANQKIISNDIDEACIRLFGQERQRKRWTYSSARPADTVASRQRWGSQDVARVRVNPRTRRATPQQLFFQEEGDTRLAFRFTAVCVGKTAENRTDAALLIAAARMVRHLGAARRRGRGRCAIHLVAVEGLGAIADGSCDTATGLALFKQLWLQEPSQETVQNLKTDQGTHAKPAQFTTTYKRFRLVAQLLEPVIVARRSQAANAFETLPEIPGTAVLGALATRAAYKLDIYQPGKHNPPDEFIQLFLRGGLSVSHLLPAVLTEINGVVDRLYPAVPAPRSLFQCENYPAYVNVGKLEVTPHTLHDGLRQELPAHGCEDLLPSGQKCGGKLKPVDGFVRLGPGQETFAPETREEVHIKLDRETDRVEEGMLYEYIALEAGQWFVGELRCDAGAWERGQQLLDLSVDQRLTLRVGKATQRGYGLVHFVLQELDNEPPTFIQAPFAQRVPVSATGVDVTMLLLTDAIVPDNWGRFYQGFDRRWLAKVLAVKPEAIQIVDDRQFSSSRIVDAFHTYRQMPRWRDEAIEAGSAAMLRIAVDNEKAAKELAACLQRLELEGIGLRRHEGFGRVAFNHPLLATQPSFTAEIEAHGIHRLLHPPKAKAAHALVEEADFRQEWREALDKKAWGDKIKADYEVVARLLFLYQHLPADELRTWLAVDNNGRPQNLLLARNLWGDKKGLAGSDKEPRLEPAGLKLILEALDDLEKRIADRPGELWAIGVGLLAEYIAKKAKGGAA